MNTRVIIDSLRAATARTVACCRRRGALSSGGTLAAALLIAPLVTAACGGSVKHPDNTSTMRVTQRAGREDVILFPVLGAGEGGWCLSSANDAGVDCPTYVLPSRAGPFAGPIVVESWSGGNSGSTGPVRTALVLTTGEVAAVSFEGGAPIRTRGQASLPDHMRSALVELRGGSGKRVFGIEEVPPLPRVRFTALNARGEHLPEGHALGPALQFHSTVRRWEGSRGPGGGICELRTKPLARLSSAGGGVMTSAAPHTDVRGREFVDCTERTYRLDGWTIQADLLIDAAHPGAPPPPLPAMQPLRGSGRDAVLQGPGAAAQTVARRVPGGWLVVTKGSGLKQRLALLEHLEVSSKP
jgi:hypothetical protein